MEKERERITEPFTPERLKFVNDKCDELAASLKDAVFIFIEQNYKTELKYAEILEVIANALAKQMISLNALCSDAYQCDPDDTFGGLKRILDGLYEINRRGRNLN